MTDWPKFAQQVKREVWGTPVPHCDEFFEAKFWKDSNGELHVRPGWNSEKWFLDRTAGWKLTCSPAMAPAA